MVRLISVSDDVYKTLTQMKEKESYSKVIRKLISKETNKNQILAFTGKDEIDVEKVKKLRNIWKKWSEKYA